MPVRHQYPAQTPGRCASRGLRHRDGLKARGREVHWALRLCPSGIGECALPATSILLHECSVRVTQL